MKRVTAVLLFLALAFTFASCGAKPVNEPKTDVPTEESTLTETTTGGFLSEPATDVQADWREKAYDAMRSAEFPLGSEVYSLSFMLTDLTGDGVPEILETKHYYEGVAGPYAILVWENGAYSEAYCIDRESEIYVLSIEAYRNKETGQIELWDLGDIDYELQDYYLDEDTGGSPVFPAIGSINENINRLEFRNGKLVVAESRDEIRNFAVYGMEDEEVKQAWEALHDFKTAFWKTHDREPVDLRSVEIEYLPLSSYSSIEEIKEERGADFYSDLEKDFDAETYVYDRTQLRRIIEKY